MTLIGNDKRRVYLTGGDRLLRPRLPAVGSAEFAEMISSGRAATLIRAAGAVAFEAMVANGVAPSLLAARGAAELAEMLASSQAPSLLAAAGSAELAEMLASSGASTAITAAGAAAFEEMTAAGLTDMGLGLIGSWLRNETLSGNIASANDLILTSNPWVQTVDARRPAGQADGTMLYVTNDVLKQTLSASGQGNNGALYWGWAGWVDHTTTGAEESYINIATLGGASANKIDVRKTTGNRIQVQCYSDGTNGRLFLSPVGDTMGTTPRFVTVEFNSTFASETDRLVITIDHAVKAWAASNIGTGGDLTTGLTPGVTGFVLLGNRRDGSAASPYQGRMPRSSLIGVAPMPGVTQGIWTAQARLNIASIDQMAA